MKILTIRGENLASLKEEFEINFTEEPLKSSGIFIITGQTGAGKSTILDALCLALFDKVPRFNKTERIDLRKVSDEEKQEDTIKFSDSRNILRRGASEGYAAVEFIALNGNKYRAIWRVKRARGKSTGALQNTSMQLYNISTQTEEQGTKKTILEKITEYIGLTFHQFTRAVLLAQGDFANFLKGNQTEKAELLEKLTGTEIYSKISSNIHNKTKEVKESLELVNKQIENIHLLSEEDLIDLNKEQEILNKENLPIKTLISSLENQLNWVKQEKQLKIDIANTENELIVAQKKISEALHRYRYLSYIEVSQDVREVYFELNNKRKLAENLYSEVNNKKNILKNIIESSDKIQEDIVKSKNILLEGEQKYNKLKPEIDEAKVLDINIQNLKSKVNEYYKELINIQEQLKNSNQNVLQIQKQKSTTEEQWNKLNYWFASKNEFTEVIPKSDLIISQLESIYSTKEQITNIQTSIESAQKVLEIHQKQLEQLEKEEKRLINLSPSEVIILRKKLIQGSPCPVCGSVHHPLENDIPEENNVNEQELEQQKKEISESVSTINTSIENTSRTITELQIQLKNSQELYSKYFQSSEELLSSVQEWKIRFEEKTLIKYIAEVTNLWSENKELLDVYSKQIENFKIRLEGEEKLLQSFKNLVKEKEGIYNLNETQLATIEEKRLKLLKGRKIDDFENSFIKWKTEQEEKYEKLKKEQEKIETEKAELIGQLTQLQTNNEENNLKISELQIQLEKWLIKNSEISHSVLMDIMSKSREWINEERKYLEDIKKQELIINTTLQERTERLQKHKESEYASKTDLGEEYLLQQLQLTEDKLKKINTRFTEIQVMLLSHEKNKEQIFSLQKKVEKQIELYENWAKLNELLGSSSGYKFKNIAQGYTLDILLEYANVHLEELTPRYKLEKIQDTLALQVIDNDMLGETRSVHSLSGGESFLISLALALGLSSLSSNQMKIESLFIDEGFGALDSETLGIAMDVLDNLQSQGRKIGIISHIEEMKERISTQIKVIKSANGKSRIQVVG